MAHPGCIFCAIAAGKAPADVLYEDATYMAFRDKYPASPQHIQVIPKRHIGNVRDLGPEDAPMLKDMLRIGCALLNVPQPNAKTRFGFHLPPFTSVPHLHMHCLSLPLKPGLCLKKYKYDPRCTLWFRTTQRQLKAWGVQPPFVRPEDVPPPKPGGFRN